MTPFDHLPSANKFNNALRLNDQSRIRAAYQEVYDRMTQFADTLRQAEDIKQPPSLANDTEEPQAVRTVYHVTAGARYWKWNCGWWQVDPTNGKVISDKPLGHTQWRKKPLIDPKDRTFNKMPKPQGEWRRVIKCHMYHDIYGKNCRIDFTDGILACVTFPAVKSADGLRELVPESHAVVHYENLSEVHVKMPHRYKKPKKKTPAKPREKKMKKSLLDLL